MIGNSGNSYSSNNSGFWIRIAIAVGIAAFTYFQYLSRSQVNPTTGEKQHVAMTVDQESALGLQTAPQMVQQYGGEAETGTDADRVHDMGTSLIQKTVAAKAPYHFQFHLLKDQKTVNAFALPGGQVFITRALYDRLQTDGQLAGVLGHEVGHVIARHGAQQLAKQNLTQGLMNSANVATNGYGIGLQQVGALLNLKYGRNDELEADSYGVKLSSQAGYDPRAMLGVMEILAKLSASGRQPEMLSTHPNPDHRAEKIVELIKQEFPNGPPSGLTP